MPQELLFQVSPEIAPVSEQKRLQGLIISFKSLIL